MQNPSKEQQYSAGFSVLKGLTRHLCKKLPEADQKRILKRVFHLGSTPRAWKTPSTLALATDEEASLILRIERHLRKLNKSDSIPRFNQLDRLLKNRGKPPFLNNRIGLLNFLLLISQKQQSSSPIPSGLKLVPQEDVKNSIFLSVPNSTNQGISNLAPACNVHRSASAELSSRAKRPTTLQTNPIRSSVSEKATGQKNKNKPVSSDSLSLLSASPSRLAASKKGAPSEENVIKELLFCFQGIPGSIFRLDHQQGFSIDPLVKIPHEGLVIKMIELGYLHNRITSQSKQLEKAGAVAQAILHAVESLIKDYYAMIGCIHSEYVHSRGTLYDTPTSENASTESESSLSIFRLFVLCREPLRMLKLTADVIKFALTSKGGAAFSAIEILRHHGDARFSKVMSQIVDQAGKPLVHMIIVWLVHGQLFDPYDEFFIAINSSCRERDIWRDKFVLRSNLVPSVLSIGHAEMILRAGKGINFLNVIREVRLPMEGLRKKLHEMKNCNIIDFANPRSHLCEMLTGVVHETSKLVLDVLNNEFKLFQHFQGLRRYILLGQGDFASYFLELIEPEMRKEASRLQYHELMSLLGTAIRGSTAAYDDPDILKGVTVKVLEASGGDWGSDVFGLQYLMHEPLDAALRVSGGAYSYMFNFLWRTKRMEHILLVLRKERWTIKNELSWMGERVPEVNNVLMFSDLMTQEFLHFAREFHYYILFEVVECSWEKFCSDFRKARSFDDVIRAHEEFLYEMRRRTFQGNDDSSDRTFINELRLVWDLVFELENLQQKFFERLLKEWELRQNRETALDSGSGTSYKEEEEFRAIKKEFKTFLSYIKAQYNIIHRNYQDVLKKFLLDLSSQKDHELRLLSSRIDYNEYYKRADSRLNESMKFSRCSDMFF